MQHGGNGTGRRRFVALLSAVGLALAVGLSAASIFTVISPAPAAAFAQANTVISPAPPAAYAPHLPAAYAPHLPAAYAPQVEVRPPVLAWSSWNAFASQIDAQLIMKQADALVSTGLKDAGYQYVNIDEGWWEGARDANGNIIPRAEKWPDGMKAVADYIHSKGLKAGIYTDAGHSGCGWGNYNSSRSGSEGYYQQDFEQFQRWGFDYVKVDWCGGNAEGLDPKTTFTEVSKALTAATAVTGHPMLLSICEWGLQQPWDWGAGLAISWRTGGDIINPGQDATFRGIMASFDAGVHPTGQHTGYYNDLDMMTVGMPGMRAQDDQTLMSLWSVMGSPLIEGADLTQLSPGSISALTNRRVLAVDQDPRGLPGVQLQNSNGLQVYEKVLFGSGRRAVVLLNRSSETASMSVPLSSMGLLPSATVRDVWEDDSLLADTTLDRGTINQSVPAESVKMFVVDGHDAPPEPASFGSPTRTADEIRFTRKIGSLGLKLVDVSYVNTGPRARAASMTTNETTTTILLPPTGAHGGTVSAIVDMRPGTNTLSFSGSDPALPDGDASLPDIRSVHVSNVGPQVVLNAPPHGTAYVSDLQWTYQTNGWGPVERDMSNGEQAAGDGNPITIEGQIYAKGIGTNSPSEVDVYLGGQQCVFSSDVGVDDEVGLKGSVVFQVWADNTKVADSGLMTGADPAKYVTANLSGAQFLRLVVTDAGNGMNFDHADWADAQVTCAGPVTTVTASPSETTDVPAGGSLEVTAQLRVGGTEPVTDVTFEPRVPAGWTVDSAAVEADRLEPGETLDGAWTITVPEDAAAGPVDVPVLATYRAVDDEPADPLIVERATVRVNVLPAGWLLTREAEAGVFSGAAWISGCGACSGGQIAGRIGNGPDNHVTVTGVEVAAAGEYELIIDYLVDGTRSFFVSVNGGAGVEVALSGTSWSTPTSTTIPVSLVAGENTVRFSNDTAYAPDLDRIVVAESD